MAHFEIRPFAAAEAATVAHWIGSPEDAMRVAGHDEWPATSDTVLQWNLESTLAFTLRRDGDLVAYGEIVEDEVEGDVEIQHLLVAPDIRRQGVGQAMLSRLVTVLAETRPYKVVWMRIGRDDTPSRSCALSIGFEKDDDLSGPRYNWLKKTLRS